MPAPDARSAPLITGWLDNGSARSQAGAARVSSNPATRDTLVASQALSLRLKPSCAFNADDRGVTAILGEPRDAQMRALSAAEVARVIENSKPLHGRFAVVHIDLQQHRVTLITDRFAVWPLCYSVSGSRIAFSDRADAVASQDRRPIDLQAIYNYAYFHVIPAPRTIFNGVSRVEPATRLTFDANGVRSSPTWRATATGSRNFDPQHASERFRALLEESVKREATPSTGAFLSGGTDSSTVVGMLTRVTGEPVDSFSIGFDASGYDEMSYARIAARHFKSRHHEHYITPAELMDAIPRVAAHYDQPFGNSSALPAFYCARMARERAIDKLLAGDGGDELFGGNTRYARQKVFAAYDAVPAWLRRASEPVLRTSLMLSAPGIKKLASYVEQARLPMPERMETYNLLDRFGAGNVFPPALLERVRVDEPSSLQRSVYANTMLPSIVDRMLAYDWRFTLSDIDLPKVKGTTELAGVAVGFPLLDDQLVDFSLSLPPSMKVRGLTLRYFFKRALRDFLPMEVLRKQKHGFGLPFGPWLVQHEALAQFARRALDRLSDRRLIRGQLVQDLFSKRLLEHAGFYGEMVWILMMLEHWLAHHAPDFKLD